MPSFAIQFSVAPFPTGFSGDLNAYATQLVANLSATITGNFLTGQVGGTAPTTNIGPWANGTSWWFWNASLPTPAYQSEFSLLQPEYNALMNGDTAVLQRFNSAQTGVGGTVGYFGPDRWKYTGSMATGRATISQQTAGITGGQFVNTVNPNIEYCYRITVTTAQASLGAGDHFEVSQAVEQQLARPLFNVPTSLGIALRSSITGTFCVSIADQALGESWVGECVIGTANTWTFVPFPAIPIFPAGCNFGASDNAFAYLVRICAAAGSTFNAGSNGAWSAANYVSDANQTNLFGTNGNTLDFTIVKHQPGSIVTPFQVVALPESVKKCKRYYFKTYEYGTAIGTVTNVGAWAFPCMASNSQVLGCNASFPEELRATPIFGSTLQTYSSGSGSSGKVLDNASLTDRTVTSVLSSAKNIGDLVATATFTNSASNGSALGIFHLVVDEDY